MHVRPARPADHAAWLRMRGALYGIDPADAEADAAAWLARPDAVVLVAERAEGDAHPEGDALAGFAELGTRPYAEGCATSPVAYLEGWWVEPDLRGRGVGRALLRAGERWARERGLVELASDALLDNLGSQRAHRALGFAEVERSVHFRKALDGPGDG